MSVLSDKQIGKLIDSEELIMHPLLDRGQIKGAKVDLRLDNVLTVIKRIDVESYDAKKLEETGQKPVDYLERHVISCEKGFVLHPGEFALALTFESVKIPRNVIGLLDGRSSLGRLGVMVHVTSGSVDPGFSGPLVLELANLGRIPVKLFPLMRIASIKFLTITGLVKSTYSDQDKYRGIKNLVHPLSRLHEDEDFHKITQLGKLV